MIPFTQNVKTKHFYRDRKQISDYLRAGVREDKRESGVNTNEYGDFWEVIKIF